MSLRSFHGETETSTVSHSQGKVSTDGESVHNQREASRKAFTASHKSERSGQSQQQEASTVNYSKSEVSYTTAASPTTTEHTQRKQTVMAALCLYTHSDLGPTYRVRNTFHVSSPTWPKIRRDQSWVSLF